MKLQPDILCNHGPPFDTNKLSAVSDLIPHPHYAELTTLPLSAPFPLHLMYLNGVQQ